MARKPEDGMQTAPFLFLQTPAPCVPCQSGVSNNCGFWENICTVPKAAFLAYNGATPAPGKRGNCPMHFLKLVVMIWFCFGVLSTLGFLWLGKKGIQALEQPSKKQPSLDRRPKTAAVVTSNAA